MSIKEDIERVEEKVKKVEEQSLAMELLKDQRKANKRMFVMWMITFLALLCVSIYTLYLLNDISSIETTTEQEISDVETIENSNITNGDMYGEDKTKENN